MENLNLKNEFKLILLVIKQTMQKITMFPYSWHIDEEEEDITSMRIYGLDQKNENVCIRIDDFTPFVYLELPEHMQWTAVKAQLVGNKLDIMLGDRKPLVKRLMYKKRLYYAHVDGNKKRKTFPYLFLSFSQQSDIRNMSYKIRVPLNIIGVGNIKVKMHEQDASPILQFTSYKNISTAGWIDFVGKRIGKDVQKTRCHHEFRVKWKNSSPNNIQTVASPLIMGFDIEVNSTNPSAMPKSEKPGDKIFQISCVLFRHGDSIEKMEKFLLTLGEPDPKTVGDDTEIFMYETEHDLLIGYTEFIQEYNPNVIIGYNILNFDIPYMIDRAKMNYCIFEFDQQGFNLYGHAKEKTIKWSSSAYGNQTFQFLDAEGRLYVDLLPLVKRDYKMDNYKLKTISTHFLGATKDPLSVKGIFKCYRIGIENKEGVYSKQAQKAMGICGRYCVQDSALVIRLFNKLQTWIGLCEMANVCNVPIFYLYTQGQQIKVYSQIYKFCLYNNFVVEKDGYVPKDGEHYQGAKVFEPKAGVYDRVLPFDFSSLYPTTIIAYNIDYSTLVIDDSISDKDCNVIEWTEHTGCKHDTSVRKTKPKHILCGDKKYRFLKEPKGVMPTVLQNLLDARKNTRVEIKQLNKKLNEQKLDDNEILSIKILIEVLNKRQLAFKISANSMYGAMGVSRGYLPFMPGAMATTAMGRKNNILSAKTIVEKYKGELIYGDSVTEDTPVLCKIGGKICYRTINDLPRLEWTQYRCEKEEAIPLDIEVWTETGFTKIKKIIRHKTKKEIFRVLTHNGVVDVTEDHGLLDRKGTKISPKEIKIGSELLTHNLPDILETFSKFNEEEAFCMGIFYSYGSCEYKYGNTCSWSIINYNKTLLVKCQTFMNKQKLPIEFKILESSGVSTLVAKGKDIISFVTKWVSLFYDKHQCKKVPDEILWSNTKIRKAFLNGYYYGDGSKYKSKIGSAGLFYLADSIGYKVGINSEYKFTYTASNYEYKVKNIESLGNTEQYVYDLETENHHFSAGIGKLIVHNTDSSYIIFPHLKTAEENWDYALHVASEITKMFPAPIELEFEQEIYWRFFILTKKRYMYKKCLRDGIVDENIGKKGVLLARRDNSMFIRDAYESLIMMIFNNVSRTEILYYMIDIINMLCSHYYSYKDFVVTKSIGTHGDGEVIPFINEKGKKKGKMGDYTVPLLSTEEKERNRQFKLKGCNNAKEYYTHCLPAIVQLAERMRQRGQRVDPGTRLEYVISSQGGHKAKQYVKVEDATYFGTHSSVLKLDYMYYLKLMANPFDDVLNILFNTDDGSKYRFQKDFVLNQYKYRLMVRTKVLEELVELFNPSIKFST